MATTPKKVRVINKMPEFVSSVERKAARTITAALVLGGSEAAALTPQHTGNLINSRFAYVRQEGGRVVGTTGYTAEYALAVHEASGKLKGQPRPEENGRPQGNYWDPRGEPRLLEAGFERAKPQIDALFRGALKV